MKSLDDIVQECDANIRVGRPQDALKRLSKLNPSRIPREWRLPLSKICRRAGAYSLGMNLLAKVVSPVHARSGMEATPAEIAEYCILLMRFGAITEASSRLEDLDTAQVPDALLFRAFGHFSRWEYAAAIPLLEQYVLADLPAYQVLVGQMNLAFALVEARHHERAVNLLKETIEVAKTGGHLQVQSTCHAFCSESYIQAGEFAKAEQELESTSKLFALQQNHDHFVVSKWKMILQGLTGNPGAFEELRAMAIKRRDWEALRDADIFSLRGKFETGRFLHLYFGSPFADLRSQLRRDFDREVDRTVYILGPKTAPRFEISSGKLDGEITSIAGGKCHQVIAALLEDFYRPTRAAGLFSSLYPDEKFDHISSPARVQEVIRRTRRWLSKEKIPSRIVESGGFYSVKIDGAFSFRVPLDRSPVDAAHLQLLELKQSFKDSRTFTNDEARKKLNLSTATTQRLLNWAIENGEVERIGQAKSSAAYRIITERAA